MPYIYDEIDTHNAKLAMLNQRKHHLDQWRETMTNQAPPMRNPGPNNVHPFERRFNDPKPRDVEHAARTVAQNEGPCSEAWLSLQRIDKYRRMGRVIDVTMLYMVHGEPWHRIKWEERESEFAKIHGYLDSSKDRKQRDWGTAVFVATAIFIVGFYFGAAYNAFLR